MTHSLRLSVCLAALFLAGAAQAQTIQLVCKVKWEQRCNDAMLKYRDCAPEFGPETSEGTIEISGNRARTNNLGVVTEFAVTRRSANEFELEGRSTDPAHFMRGWGVLDSATWKLKLVFTLGGSSGVGILQRGLEADCR